MVKPGDPIPDVELLEGAPDKKVSLAKELASGKGVIVGVPAAFSPGCTAHHVPGYINSKHLANSGKVFIVAVNDPFVMKAWGEHLDPGSKSGIRYLADVNGDFTKQLDALFSAPGVFGDPRSKRLALVTQDGKIHSVHIEPDNTGINESAAEKVLGA
ncbi:peroxiredoxin pmp20 [Lecanosticta acicola]|uniref:Peroxiredoxin pmp20 n=1 Tax=Lecanosticta acicola TaxID=111012 RepID=A0AAI8Z8E9_9PEZI|nr:peroxiredoxin pmp20 [Lecanosticta acicola]